MVLLLSTTNDSVVGVVEGLFNVFGEGGKLDVPTVRRSLLYFIVFFCFFLRELLLWNVLARQALGLKPVALPEGFGICSQLPEPCL